MLTTKQVAELFGLTRGRIIQLIHGGVIKAKKWGRDYMIREEDLSELKRLRAMKPGGNPPPTINIPQLSHPKKEGKEYPDPPGAE